LLCALVRDFEVFLKVHRLLQPILAHRKATSRPTPSSEATALLAGA
jgi:hypothetical protein